MTQADQLTQRIVPFYLGEQPDAQGRMIQDIWSWNFEELECVHDFIQWLFPLPEKSTFNPDAPVVDDTVIQAFHSNAALRQNLVRSLEVMLLFYGFQRQLGKDGKSIIVRSEDALTRRDEWICPFDHNYLRITRILKCLMVFGLKDEAIAWYGCLRQLYEENSDAIGAETFQYWTRAIET
jgi:hypothetical protein